MGDRMGGHAVGVDPADPCVHGVMDMPWAQEGLLRNMLYEDMHCTDEHPDESYDRHQKREWQTAIYPAGE